MSYQERIAQLIVAATESVCRTASFVPEDKLNWAPAETARTVMSQMQELATFKDFLLPAITEGKFPPLNDHVRAEWMERRSKLNTLQLCIDTAKASALELAEAVRKVPDDQLDQKIILPFGEGVEKTIAEILIMPYWNLTYHEGQINYIQTLLGDRRMH